MSSAQKVLVFRHVRREHLGTLAPALKGAGFSVSILDAWKRNAAFPSARDFRALVVMGGPMAVYERERYPFLKQEISLIRKFIAQKKPVLGICLGSQLIAHAIGGRVFPNRRKEIGWYSVRLTAAGRRDPLFKRAGSAPRVFQWHGDTFTLPRGAVHLAASPLCRIQAFRWGTNVYGLQFHVEIDAKMIREWVSPPGAREEVEGAGTGAWRALRTGTPKYLPGLAHLARPMYGAFVNLLKI